MPGKCGNPRPTGGKPDKLMRDSLIIALKREAIAGNGKMTMKLTLIAEALVDKAITGDVPAIKEIFERVDGRVPISAEITTTKDVTDLSRDELLSALAAHGIVGAAKREDESGSVH